MVYFDFFGKFDSVRQNVQLLKNRGSTCLAEPKASMLKASQIQVPQISLEDNNRSLWKTTTDFFRRPQERQLGNRITHNFYFRQIIIATTCPICVRSFLHLDRALIYRFLHNHVPQRNTFVTLPSHHHRLQFGNHHQSPSKHSRWVKRSPTTALYILDGL